ncbi:protein of unknown function [Candidatus Promineifilum breve]|uniref:Polymerase nucleotidyl transferase domain-containing protein n=1 Tax=Candidatus Promineifilum breve TaxID=1806508 RepID=A0A160T4E3_9CHLR|nr:nucleotidyltransferase domain-containing protein [Candidatus Promineifilum breve]CUS03968.2 protein of unknown function [Candidatus Promineifilum breve]
MIKPLTSSLSEVLLVNESEAIEVFKNALCAELEHQLFEIWLFGSKARGEAIPDSDLDLLVVVRDLAPSIRWRIRELAADCSFDYDVLINTHILDQSGWEAHAGQKSTFWREIERDGVALIQTPQFTLA